MYEGRLAGTAVTVHCLDLISVRFSKLVLLEFQSVPLLLMGSIVRGSTVYFLCAS